MTAMDVLDSDSDSDSILVWQIILSDLVVWWRAWVLWPESRMVRMSGCVLLLATFGEPSLWHPTFFSLSFSYSRERPYCTVLSVVDTAFSCQLQMGFMFEGLAVGTAAAALSLATNFTATVLTAYQAWYVRTPSLLNIGAWRFWDSVATALTRRTVLYYCRLYRKSARDYAESGSMNNRVQHILALLVESGALYCALWVRLCARVPRLSLSSLAHPVLLSAGSAFRSW